MNESTERKSRRVARGCLLLLPAVHLVDGVLHHGGLDALDPLLHVGPVFCLHLVGCMLALHKLALAIDLGTLDRLALLADNLEAKGLLVVSHLSHNEILQWDGPLGLLVLLRFKVVQAVVAQSEPALSPRLVTTTLLGQVAVALRVEEGHTLAVLVVRNLERHVLDAVIQHREKSVVKALALVNAAVHV